MDLNYLVGSNPALIDRLNAQAYDPEVLLTLADDLLSLTDALNMTPLQAAQFAIRLKRAYDESQGKLAAFDVIADEVSKQFPSRLSVERKGTGAIFFFRKLPGQKPQDETSVEYMCEMCNGRTLRANVKQHVSVAHENISIY
mmetsp:Transcript_12364/g.23436  ORF Transcript_12364/g.23436 Transcript_12364/m.23436 type:complete len:142 (+) Transcript_12364:1726-2151(+)